MIQVVMTSDKLRVLSQMPLKQLSNRVWRTYQGGALIDKWKNVLPHTDSSMPEEWIMSAISPRGKNRPADEGLSRLTLPGEELLLRDLVAADPELFLGKRIAAKFGTTGVLIKMIDSKERLTIQVHPDKKFAMEMFHSAFGKTESWYVLSNREIKGEKSCVYLGFKEGVTEEYWSSLFYKQDINGMLHCLHRFEVNPGDAFIIYGGVPHAIGAGCFLMEVQEPTDYTMRVEKITPNGLVIVDELIHQGLGEASMLACFHYDCCSFVEAKRKWKVEPTTIERSSSFTLKSVFTESQTDCFALNELMLNGEKGVKGNGDFFVAVVYYGEGSVFCGGKEYPFSQGDELFFPAALSQVIFRSTIASKILLCYPPL